MRLNQPITSIKGVGDSRAGLFARLGIQTVRDLINHYPTRYEDYSQVTKLNELHPGKVSVKGRVTDVKGRYGRRRGLHITEALLKDDSGSIRVTWFNQPYRAASIKKGKEYYLSGTYDHSGGRLALMNPSMELVESFRVNTARVIPIYRVTKGLTSGQIRKALTSVRGAIKQIEDPLPDSVVTQAKILPLSEALDGLHFPEKSEVLLQIQRELGFRELFEISLASQLLKRELAAYRAPKVPVDEKVLQAIVQELPYELTDLQRQVAWSIIREMSESQSPINRLVEGDVGSGKTVIAGLLAANTISSGGQVTVMAPTELLANQHLKSFQETLAPVMERGQIVLITGSQKKAVRKKAEERVSSGKAKLVIGTHALFQEAVNYNDLRLIIVDEQHRFGVEQRKSLLKKADYVPHVVTLTATPIPRSLGLVVYGELDISLLAEKPPGRKEVSTELVTLASRRALVDKVVKQASSTNQVYIVCPAIEESEVGDSVEEVFADLTKHHPDAKLEILHGKLKSEEKEEIMQRFVDGETHILVATTVIEVGVNVVTAHTMLIYSPHRFGLAQLHQLRGRVGRGEKPGACYLMLADNQAPGKRLRAIAGINDGFRLSEIDLELRGPGSIYGTRQSGVLDLRLANLGDHEMVALAREQAEQFVKSGESLVKYKQLRAKVSAIQKVTNLN